jgi:chromosome segregation ATPase
MTYLTNSERERLAYAEGYTETAAILARLDDAHAALGSETAMQAQLDDALDDVHRLQDELELERALCSDLRSEADQWHEEYKKLRSALMALEAEVSPGMRAFIREVLA